MAGLTTPIADSSDDTEHTVEGAVSLDTSISPERWLHSETVDELRLRRARIGLPSTRDLASVPRPPFTAPSAPFVGMTAPSNIRVVRAEWRLAELFGTLAETVRGWVTRISAAVIAYLGNRSSSDGTNLRGE